MRAFIIEYRLKPEGWAHKQLKELSELLCATFPEELNSLFLNKDYALPFAWHHQPGAVMGREGGGSLEFVIRPVDFSVGSLVVKDKLLQLELKPANEACRDILEQLTGFDAQNYPELRISLARITVQDPSVEKLAEWQKLYRSYAKHIGPLTFPELEVTTVLTS